MENKKIEAASKYAKMFSPDYEELGISHHATCYLAFMAGVEWKDRQKEKTTLKRVKDEVFITGYDLTKCCNKGPITDENYCPHCGAEIVR